MPVATRAEVSNSSSCEDNLITINFDFITKTFTYLGKADRNTRLKPSNLDAVRQSVRHCALE